MVPIWFGIPGNFEVLPYLFVVFGGLLVAFVGWLILAVAVGRESPGWRVTGLFTYWFSLAGYGLGGVTAAALDLNNVWAKALIGLLTGGCIGIVVGRIMTIAVLRKHEETS